jgi:hypothetical protein
VTFRPYPGGTLTGIPAEQIVRIERGEVATFPAESAESTIEPGEVRALEPGVAGSDVPVVGSNGTPVMSGTPQLTIGPNGTPVLAPGAQPVVGPNGAPVLAPPGRPGSAAPSTAPNGFPSAPAPGH